VAQKFFLSVATTIATYPLVGEMSIKNLGRDKITEESDSDLFF
jgi:hypothetical protein